MYNIDSSASGPKKACFFVSLESFSKSTFMLLFIAWTKCSQGCRRAEEAWR